MMSMRDAPAFGALLRRYRRAAGLTQEALAERALLSVYTISALERGANQAPRKDTLVLLADALCLEPPARAALEAAALRHGAARDAPAPARSAIPLVGRARELALLDGHLAGDGPPLLLLAGEPGIGKSRLLREAVERAIGGGWTVLAGGCTRRGGQDPYAPLTEALQQPLRARREPAVLVGCAWLVCLLPELTAGPIEPLPPWTLTPAQERRLTFAAVGRFLTNLAGPAGTLLVLDDLQWAGPDALDLLLSLLRAAPAVPLRVVGSYRDTEAPAEAPLAATLADLTQAGLVRHHALAPLSTEEVDQLLEAVLEGVAGAGSAVWARVVQRTGGVPFFVLSCAQALRLHPEEAPGVEAVPWDVAQGIRQRVAALPAHAQEALSVAAVLGRVVQPTELAAVAEQPQHVVLAGLEAAGRARLLVEEGGAYHFAHDLIRDVVEADVGVARRLVLHRRVAEALAQEADPCPLEQVAYHYGRSDAPRKAIPYLEQAGDQARIQAAYAAAEDYYRTALDGLDTVGHGDDAARLQAKLGELLCLTGRSLDALRELDRAAATYRAAGEMERLANVMALVSRAHERRGAAEEGLRGLQAAVALVEAHGPSRGLAVVYVAQAGLLFHAGRYQEQRAVAERAVDLARALCDDLLLARALFIRGLALRFLEPGPHEDHSYKEAARLADACGDVETLSGALYHLAIRALLTGDIDQAVALNERSLLLTERVGDQVFAAQVLAMRGLIGLYSGEWGHAEADLQQARQLARGADTVTLVATVLTVLGHLRVLQGRSRAARRHLTEAAALADSEMNAFVRRVRAELDLLDERPADARATLVSLLTNPTGDKHDHAFILPSLAWAELQLGDIRAAAATAAEGATRARVERNRLALTDALRVQARVAVEQQAWTEAAQALEEGLALTRRMPYPFAEARLLEVDGALHRAQGETPAAQARLEEALTIFRRLGARTDAERVRQAISALSRATVGPSATKRHKRRGAGAAAAAPS